MAVSDAKHRFIDVTSAASGRRADANVFRKSIFGNELERGTLNLPPPCSVSGVEGDLPFVFLGDTAFKKSENLVNPSLGECLLPEKLFNYRHSRARRIVENAFAIMCARFRILRRDIIGSRPWPSLWCWHVQLFTTFICWMRTVCHQGSGNTALMGTLTTSMKMESMCMVAGGMRTRMENIAARVAEEIEDANEECVGADRVREMLLHYFVKNPVPWQWKKKLT